MIAEFGHYALVLAFALSLAQSVLPMVGAQRGLRPWMSFARPATTSPRKRRMTAPSEG